MSTNQIPQRPQFGSSGQGAGEPVHISWSGSPWDLIGLSFVNFFLTIITLGIYSFWGKTEVRRRIWSSVRLQGEPLAYTGTGRELFVGFLIVFGAVLLPMYLLAIAAVLAFGPRSLLAVAVQYSLFALFLFLAGVATYRARRYRLTRTLWRGIRGGMAGSPAGYATTSFFSSLLLPLSLGWTSPWQANLLHKRLASETTFGNQQFAYEGGSGPMYGRFALLWVGGLVLYFGMLGTIFMAFGPRLQALAVGAQQAQQRGTPAPMPAPGDILGIIGIVLLAGILFSIISAWYSSTQFNIFTRYTSFAGAKLSGHTTGLGLLGLTLSNLLLVIFSLGILKPVAQARAARFYIERVKITGNVPSAAIAQSTAPLGRGGEGLAQAFDLDAF